MIMCILALMCLKCIGLPIIPIRSIVDFVSSPKMCRWSSPSCSLLLLHIYGIYEHLLNGDAILTHIGTEETIADVLAKALVGEKFKRFSIALLGNNLIKSFSLTWNSRLRGGVSYAIVQSLFALYRTFLTEIIHYSKLRRFMAVFHFLRVVALSANLPIMSTRTTT